MAILEVKNLKVYFQVRGGIFGRVIEHVKAVDDVSFSVEEKETLGLIGESGSGKSTIGKAIMGLVPLSGGNIFFNGENITNEIGKNRCRFRKDIQMIFQSTHSSLNPKKRVLDIIAEPLRNFEKNSRIEEQKKVDALLSIVGLSPADALKYPHEFSGGQKQRIGIARAVALKPKLLIADEPVSALDLSIQSQVLSYLKLIQEQLNLSCIFISHDMGVVRHMCQSLAIMHNAQFVETGSCQEIYTNPQQLYTRRLIASIPEPDPTRREENQRRRHALEDEWRLLCRKPQEKPDAGALICTK
ncbi:MAG: ATP-binding cassette domain-containing protein [Defluviitaleaceae bacterium]|nr:ATP-binding cassette domain-containing protein [Defluviitaleaceae bacterium]